MRCRETKLNGKKKRHEDPVFVKAGDVVSELTLRKAKHEVRLLQDVPNQFCKSKPLLTRTLT